MDVHMAAATDVRTFRFNPILFDTAVVLAGASL